MSLNVCQPGNGVGCGCCCGLFASTLDEAIIAARLAARSQALLGAGEALFRDAAARFTSERRSWEPPGGAVAHCALAGFLAADRRGVGCLGHAQVTGGADLRDLGNFGAHSCEAFQCPSVGALSDEEILLARDGCGEWYLYGLVVTDVAFLRACLAAVAQAAGRRLEAAEVEGASGLQQALRALFALKVGSRPFGSGPDPAWDVGSLAGRVAGEMRSGFELSCRASRRPTGAAAPIEEKT